MERKRFSRTKPDWQPFKTLQGMVRLVLLVDWDPIGVFGHPGTLDEYDSYAAEISARLLAGESAATVADCLRKMQEENMRLRANPEHVSQVAEKLCAMSENFHRVGDRTVLTLAEQLVETIHFLFDCGLAPGTGGNFSVVSSRDPLRLLITPSGVNKGEIAPFDLIEVDAEGAVRAGNGAPSAETPLHLTLVRLRQAGASIWNTLLSRHGAAEGALVIEGYEMLKGLQGVKTHTHREIVPILENSQDMQALSAAVEEALERHPDCHGFLIAGHGLTTWGDTLFTARRHVEILEFLFEVVARERLRDAR